MCKRILLIEEDPCLRRKWKKFLEWERYQVTIADSKESAIHLMRDLLLEVDLIVVSIPKDCQDIRPKVAGLRECSSTSQILLVVENSNDLGEVSYDILAKPFYPEQLVLRTKRLLCKPRESGQIGVNA
ncbi:MAG: hypothetical protein JSU96_07975 [Acidobacteriota bacterium]|nr:MAG: hypothetical protein JSU96_07975 [Acidobacteriota bacterium]